LAKYGKPVWQIVLEAAESIDQAVFTPKDVIDKAHENYPDVPDTTLRTYVIAMAPDHPSSHHYPSTRKNHPCFKYLGSGQYSMDFKLPPGNDKSRSDNGSCDSRDVFVEKYGEFVRAWVEEHFDELIEARNTYSWNDKPMVECVRDRNMIQAAIIGSRVRNGGGVDLATLDRVMDWGGLKRFALDEDEALKVTGKAFGLLDSGDLKGAILRLLSVYGVGISSASKVVGLSDQNRFAIYDSRVGTALRSLVVDGRRLIKCPAGRGRPGDACSNRRWAENYERLIWVLEIMSGYLSQRCYPFSVADVEMALFMMGE